LIPPTDPYASSNNSKKSNKEGGKFSEFLIAEK
jgi:hypothetical protein